MLILLEHDVDLEYENLLTGLAFLVNSFQQSLNLFHGQDAMGTMRGLKWSRKLKKEVYRSTNRIWAGFHHSNFDVLCSRLDDLRKSLDDEFENGGLVLCSFLVVVFLEIFSNRLFATSGWISHVLVECARRFSFEQTRRAIIVEPSDQHCNTERTTTRTLGVSLNENNKNEI